MILLICIYLCFVIAHKVSTQFSWYKISPDSFLSCMWMLNRKYRKMSLTFFCCCSCLFFSVSPEVNLQNVYYVGREKSVSLDCKVEGYPPPSITWTQCAPQENVCDQSMLNISKVSRDEIYTCTAKNSLGNDTKNTSLGKSVYLMYNLICLQLWVDLVLIESDPLYYVIHVVLTLCELVFPSLIL